MKGWLVHDFSALVNYSTCDTDAQMKDLINKASSRVADDESVSREQIQ